MLVRGIPIFFRLTADVAAIGIYVVDHLRCAARGALVPRAHAADARLGVRRRVFVELSAARRQEASRLSSIAMCIGAVGLMAMGVEYCIDRYFLEAWQPSWSLVVLVICIGLIIPLRIVRRVPSLREEA